MSQEYSIPDPTTPCISKDHEIALQADPRYNTDATYRDAVISKFALSLPKDAPAPGKQGKNHSIMFGKGKNGEVSEGGGLDRVVFTDKDVRDKALELSLNAQREDLQRQAERREAAAPMVEQTYLNDPNLSIDSAENQARALTPFANLEAQLAAQGSSAYRSGDPRVQQHVISRIAAGMKLRVDFT